MYVEPIVTRSLFEQQNDCHAVKHHLTEVLIHAEFAADALLRRAACSYKLGEYYEAIADSGKAIKFAQDNIDALELRGRAYYKLGESEMAMNHWKQGLKVRYSRAACFNSDLYRVRERFDTLCA